MLLSANHSWVCHLCCNLTSNLNINLPCLSHLICDLMSQLDFAAPARLPGFHVCVGSGGERLLPEWYQEKGDFGFHSHFLRSTLLIWWIYNYCIDCHVKGREKEMEE